MAQVSDPDKKALHSTHDMIDHCIVVFAVVVVLTCVMSQMTSMIKYH